MGPGGCPGCDQKLGRKKYGCASCKQSFCRTCCKRYLALEGSTEQVRLCNECFLKNVNWNCSRAYDLLGPPDGKPVVLVHGALAGRQCLILEARAWAEKGYRVILPDLPAHGARYKEPLSLASAIEALREVIEKESGGQKVAMMGFSMGGYLTAAFAAAHPDMVAAVVLGACAHNTCTATWRMVGRMASLVYRMSSYKTKSTFMYRSAGMDVKRPDVQECFLRAGAEYDAWDGVWRVMHDADMLNSLPKIPCPAMLVAGEQDFRQDEKRFASLLKHGRLLVLAGGEHAFVMQPDIVQQFRKECEPLLEAAFWGPIGSPPPAEVAACWSGEASKDGTQQQEGVNKRVGLGVLVRSVRGKKL